jgi:predicted NUDIX family NTP pyrophosphohydrolase
VTHTTGKKIVAWAVEGSWDTSRLRSNTFSMEWPPKSGKKQEFPEIDRAEFFPLPEARLKIHEAECAFLDRLADHLHVAGGPVTPGSSERHG